MVPLKQCLFLNETCCFQLPASSNGLRLPLWAVPWYTAQVAHQDPGTRPSGFQRWRLLVALTESFAGNCTRPQRTAWMSVLVIPPGGSRQAGTDHYGGTKLKPLDSIQNNSAGPPKLPGGWAEASVAAAPQPTFSG